MLPPVGSLLISFISIKKLNAGGTVIPYYHHSGNYACTTRLHGRGYKPESARTPEEVQDIIGLAGPSTGRHKIGQAPKVLNGGWKDPL